MGHARRGADRCSKPVPSLIISTDYSGYIDKKAKPITVRQSDPELDGSRLVWNQDVIGSSINRLLAACTAVAFGGAEQFIPIGQRLHDRIDRFENILRACVGEARRNRKDTRRTTGNGIGIQGRALDDEIYFVVNDFLPT